MNLPNQGLVFWPVGNGDSTTVVISDKLCMQVDLHDMEKADGNDDPAHPVIDQLVKLLPKKGGKPYLAAFVLTHPDEDHCQGFAELQKRVTIGELWFTPRTFTEYKKDLCEDAQVFQKEANRRVAANIKNGSGVQSGDRIRIVGYDDILMEAPYKGLPATCLSSPGTYVAVVDGVTLNGKFHAFLHAPFKDDMDEDRNDTSLGMQIGIANDVGAGFALLFGDLSYPILKKIFDRSKADTLQWNVLLAPHHCSKTAMYVREDDKDVFKKDIMDEVEKHRLSVHRIVASSNPIPGRDEEGALPPHKKAKDQYEKIVESEFVCTHEYPSKASPEPVVFEVTKSGLVLVESKGKGDAKKTIGVATAAAREGARAHTETAGFGKRG